jgi:hypothetical protein
MSDKARLRQASLACRQSMTPIIVQVLLQEHHRFALGDGPSHTVLDGLPRIEIPPNFVFVDICGLFDQLLELRIELGAAYIAVVTEAAHERR